MKTYKLAEEDIIKTDSSGNPVKDTSGNLVYLQRRGDRIIEGGRPVMIQGRECLAQRLQNAIVMDKGSWFLAPSKGFPWFDILGTKSVSKRVIYSEIQKIIMADDEVASINYIEIEFTGAERSGMVSFSVNSIYEEEVSGTV